MTNCISSFFFPHTQATMELANKHGNDPKALKVIFSSILLICKIFNSLNFQVLFQFSYYFMFLSIVLIQTPYISWFHWFQFYFIKCICIHTGLDFFLWTDFIVFKF